MSTKHSKTLYLVIFGIGIFILMMFYLAGMALYDYHQTQNYDFKYKQGERVVVEDAKCIVLYTYFDDGKAYYQVALENSNVTMIVKFEQIKKYEIN